MLSVPRWLLATLSVGFALYHATIGLLAWQGYDSLLLLAGSIVVYLLTIVAAVSFGSDLEIGRIGGLVVVLGALLTSTLSALGISSGMTGTYASWYVGAMGVVLGVLAARGQPTLAWISVGLVCLIVIEAAGFGGLLTAGVLGVAVLVAAGQATSTALRRADLAIDEIQIKTLASESAISASEAADSERQNRLNNLTSQVLVALEEIAGETKPLTSDKKTELLQLESSLRAEIQGRGLLSKSMRLAVDAARKRGVQVLLLDEGGMNQLREDEKEAILNRVATAMNLVKAGKAVVRSPRGESWVVTLIATRPGTDAPDLWLKF